MSDPQPPFLDVPSLLESSQPNSHRGWFWYGVGVFLLVVMISTYVDHQYPQYRGLVNLFSVLTMLAVMAAMGAMTFAAVQRQRQLQQNLESIEELIQLRRWDEAAGMLQSMLSRPIHTQGGRIQSLIYLTSVLARFHRFDDAIAIEDYLLEHVHLDPSTEYALRLGRAMAMLRQDHLVDADRAISELRRIGGDTESAGLALVEIYRDVKTGHPAEAIHIFNERTNVLKQQLGHRFGDAYALIARASEQLGDEAAAKTNWERATVLSHPSELQRRYPEVSHLAQKFGVIQPPSSPAEAA